MLDKLSKVEQKHAGKSAKVSETKSFLIDEHVRLLDM